MTYKVILPIIDDNLNILYYIDAENHIYKDIVELFAIDENVRLFFELFELFTIEFEKFAEEHMCCKFDINRNYSGHSLKYSWYTESIILPSAISDSPRIMKIKGYYKDTNCQYYLHNIKELLREEVNEFNFSLERISNHQKYIDYFVDCILPKCQGSFKNYFPNTIASASRNIIGALNLRGYNAKGLSIEVRSCAVGGLYYLKDKRKYSKVYNYDISSMYPALLVNKYYPNMTNPPLVFNKYIKVKKPELALYHLTDLVVKLKPNHFPCVFTQKGLRKRLEELGNVVGDNFISLQKLPIYEGWITSIDWQLLNENYYVYVSEIDKTYLYTSVVKGDIYFERLKDYYDLKQESEGTIKTLYKVIIDSFSGSLCMSLPPSIIKRKLTEEDTYMRSVNCDDEPLIEIYAFMTAYGRYEINKLALKSGYDNVISIDTDGIFTTSTKLNSCCEEGLGNLRLDKVMQNAKWFGQKQYEYQDEDNKWIGTICGLHSYLYEHGKTDYDINYLSYDKSKKKYIKKTRKFSLGGNNEIR